MHMSVFLCLSVSVYLPVLSLLPDTNGCSYSGLRQSSVVGLYPSSADCALCPKKLYHNKTVSVVIRRGSPGQTKESARRYVIYCVGLGHMFLLFGCGPYVSIMCRWAICFYWLAVGVGLGHMFLLCAAGPYVCIGWLWAWR